MTIGLITEPKSYTRKYFLIRLLKLRAFEKIAAVGNSFDVRAEVLPFSHQGLEKLSAFRLEKLISRRVRLLKKAGVAQLILSEYLFKLCTCKGIDTSGFANGQGRRIFLSLMPLCIRQTAKKSDIDLFSANVCIRDTKMDRISEYLIRELCYDTKKLYLCTQNSRSAKSFCETFFDETGLWVDVCDRLNFHCDILLDVDNSRLQIGNDLFVVDAKLNYNFGGYSVSHTDAATLLSKVDLSMPSWVFSYYEK